MRIRLIMLATAVAIAIPLAAPALASPWAEVGDNQLRSDIEVLAAARVIDGITIHWPLPWRSIVSALGRASMAGQPAAVRAAAARVLARAGESKSFKAGMFADATNQPSVVYGFDGMGRGKGEAQLSLEASEGIFSGRIALGGYTQDFRGRTFKAMPEGTYFSADVAGALVYGGYMDHWWGPGQISALQLSNNARPMPQIGIERSSTEASSWRLLKYLGPWQAEFFVAYMDGPRLQPNTYFSGARLTIDPLPGLELAIARTEEFCGQGHPCAPIRDYFHFQNDTISVNNTNDELAFDLKYSGHVGSLAFQSYIQLMNEDYSWFNHSGTSHLFGLSGFVPAGDRTIKLTAEFTDTIATHHPFSFGDNLYSFSYTNYSYLDGMRYRDRTLGFSLDDDSTLASLQASWSDSGGRFYEISLHHATIGTSYTLTGANIVSTLPVALDMGEARISLPWNGFRLEVAGRLEDDQPRPRSGFAAAIEVGLHADL